MTPQEENEAIAAWAGLECKCSQYDRVGSNRWDYCPRHSNNGNPPDYDRDEVAVSLLPIIVRKGYPINLYYDRFGVHYIIKISGNPGILRIEGLKPTTAAAIKKSILVLLEKESP